MATTKLGFIVQRPGYKSENPKLAFTHAISSQTVEIYLEDGDVRSPWSPWWGRGFSTSNPARRDWKSTV